MSSEARRYPESIQHAQRIRCQQAFKLALSLTLFYWFALWTNWDVPQYGALAIIIISLGTTGASLQKGLLRIVGTTAGVLIGFLIIGLFNDDRWAVMLALSLHIIVIGYFMQGSRNNYAWYVAAFVPLVIWGDNYPNFASTFYFGTFRYLETTVGVLIYTLVDILLWPRSAGEQLRQQGNSLLKATRETLVTTRERIQGEPTSPQSPLLTDLCKQTLASLQDAYADTQSIRANRPQWEDWQSRVERFVNSLEACSNAIDECEVLKLDQILPSIDLALDAIQTRVEQIDDLWPPASSSKRPLHTAEPPVVLSPDLTLDRSAHNSLSSTDRAVTSKLLSSIKTLDQDSCALLRSARILTGLAPFTAPQQVKSLQPAWNPQHFSRALFPAIAFLASCLLWILMNPPTGPKIPMFAGIISLVILRTPMNPLPLLGVFLLSIVFLVAPIYWLLMPRLTTGYELLSLIFIYAFTFGYLGAKSPALKSGPLIMFATMSGISNQQQYSFQGPVDGALMVLIAGSLVSATYMLLRPFFESTQKNVQRSAIA